MNIWQMLGMLITAVALMDILLGKEVNTPDGSNLGVAADIKLDFQKGKIWVIVKDRERWRMIPGEQIGCQSDTATLLADWLPSSPTQEIGILI